MTVMTVMTFMTVITVALRTVEDAGSHKFITLFFSFLVS